MVEIIKHGIFQSPKLYNYIQKNKSDILNNNIKIKKVALWTLELKRICLEIDPKETIQGSKRILRGGHDYSDKIEEKLKLEIPHGFAVSIGITKQLEFENQKENLKKAKDIFHQLKIPTKIKDLI